MFWLQSPPWGRWVVSSLLVATAVWAEFRPDPSVDHPFAVTEITPGEVLTFENTEMRRIPGHLLEPVPPGGIATRSIAPGSPVLASDLGDHGSFVPTGWWVVAMDLPSHARRGDTVELVLLDTGDVVAGVVANSPAEDPFTTADGGVAVSPAHAAEVAAAAAEGRVSVLVSTG